MKFLLVLSVLLASYSTIAQTISGSACDAGSSKILIDRSGTNIKISFSDYEIAPSGNAIQRETCNIALPVSVPRGKKLIIKKILVSESYKLSKKSHSTLSVSAFYPGQKGETLSYSIGSDKKKTIGKIVLGKKARVASKCGESTILRLNSGLTLNPKNHFSSYDKVDVSKIVLSLALQDC